MKNIILTLFIFLLTPNIFACDWYKLELNASRIYKETDGENNCYTQDTIVDTFTFQGVLVFHNKNYVKARDNNNRLIQSDKKDQEDSYWFNRNDTVFSCFIEELDSFGGINKSIVAYNYKEGLNDTIIQYNDTIVQMYSMDITTPITVNSYTFKSYLTTTRAKLDSNSNLDTLSITQTVKDIGPIKGWYKGAGLSELYSYSLKGVSILETPKLTNSIKVIFNNNMLKLSYPRENVVLNFYTILGKEIGTLISNSEGVFTGYNFNRLPSNNYIVKVGKTTKVISVLK